MTNRELDRCIESFLNGDESSFDLIYHETKKSVYLSIYTVVKDQSTIEDLMQDTYMKAINALNYYKLGTNFKAWISRIAKNNALNYIKRKNREEVIDSDERPDLFGTTTANYYLDFATRNLTEIEKDIIIYRIILDLKFKEISEILDIPLGTIYWNYQNAVKKIKEEIQE